MAPTPEGVVDPVRSLEVQVRALESRVVSAEGAVARMWALAVAALLVTGQLLGFLTYEDQDKTLSPSLLTFGTSALAYTDEDGHRDTFTVVLGIAFVGLSLLTVVALASLLGVLRRTEPRGTPNRRAPIAVLLVVGLLGAWLTVLLAAGRSGRDPVHLHAGLPVFTVGVLLYAWLVVSESGRELWLP